KPGHIGLTDGLPYEKANDVITGPWSRWSLDDQLRAIQQSTHGIGVKDRRFDDDFQEVGCAAVNSPRKTTTAGPSTPNAHRRSSPIASAVVTRTGTPQASQSWRKSG